jgi:D-alanyl-D-alanine dipeptidase
MAKRLLAILLACSTVAVAQQPAVFRITPVRPVAELEKEALKATPPKETGDFLPSDLVDIAALDNTIHLDVRYATTNNFLSTRMYTSARAFAQRPAAQALLRAHRSLMKEGYGVLIHDAYRPWYVTKVFWDATPVDKHAFVADPQHGSKHNRGCAIDMSIYDLKTGKAVEMPSLYDEMSERAYSNYAGGTAEQNRLRAILRTAMEAEGYVVNPTEWWHFDYKDWQRYPIGNTVFEKLAGP